MRLQFQNIYFTSDWHLFHNNIIRFDNRPFENIEQMNETIVENLKNTIPSDGILFYLGDLTFGNPIHTKNLLDSLDFKMYWIKGNHDKDGTVKKLYTCFVDVIDFGMDIWVLDEDCKDKYQHIVLSHYPILSWNRSHHGSWMLHGHSHQNLLKNEQTIRQWYYSKKVLDVGCNGWDYSPISYDEIKKIMKQKNE